MEKINIQDRLIIFVIILLIGLPFNMAADVPNENFQVKLFPHYYLNGTEIIYSESANFTEISFDILGKNTNWRHSVTNLSITYAYPDFLNASFYRLSNDTEFLGYLQEKILWKSRIIDVRNFSGQNLTFLVDVQGVMEDKTFAHDGDYVKILIKAPEVAEEENLLLGVDKKFSFLELGEFVWEGNPYGGIWLLILIICISGFFYWKNSLRNNAFFKGIKEKYFKEDIREVNRIKSKYIDPDFELARRWKAEQERKKAERERREEGW